MERIIKMFALVAFVWFCFIFNAIAFQQEKRFKLDVNEKQLMTIIKGLQEMPFKESADLINSIYQQATVQSRIDTTRPPAVDTIKQKKK